MTTQFDKIAYGSDVGKMRIAASGMAWKGQDSEKMVTMVGGDIKWAQWLRVARNFQLRIGLANHRRELFDGFDRADHDKIANLIKTHFSVTLETKEISFKGWNWGDTDFQGEDLAFVVSDRTAFELPLQNVANSNIAGKTEVSLEFANLSGSKSKSGGDEMVEIRFHVPGTQTKAKNKSASDAGSQKSDDEEEEEEISAAQVFHDMIKEKADIGQVTGDIVLSFEEVLVLTPRGRYDVDMFPEFLRLRGKTYDYKIVYTSISRLFLLPKDDQHVLFILALDTPIRQGQTRYQYLVMQFSREEEITAELNMEEEEVAKYDRLQKSYEDTTFEVVSSVFRGLAKKKIIGAGSFQSRNGNPGVKANMKATQGDLFILEKYIFFVSKTPQLIDISDIHSVSFSRVGGGSTTSARTFDITIITKSGPEFVFSSINKEEHDPMEKFLKDKKVRVKAEVVPDVDMVLGDDSEEEDDASISSEDSRPKKKVTKGGDDDESEEDEDFRASSSDSGSPSESDSDSEGAATASDASGDREFTKKKKKKDKDGSAKKKKKKAAADGDGETPKKKKAKKKGSDDEMDVDDDEDKPKKKKKKDAAEDGMDIDEDKPRPKPKPKKKADGDEVEPPKKKPKLSSD